METNVFNYYTFYCKKSLKIPQGVIRIQNPYIEDGQTTQWPKTKAQTTIYKAYT